MRSKNVFFNMIATFIELLITTITSFIVPHYIILAYGSNVNGLIVSITQFLSYISLIESGIGAIGRASLYKPLSEHDDDLLSKNAMALEKFYRNISYIFLAYLVVLAALFPVLVDDEFGWLYVSSLVVIQGMSTFVQYYFGITCQTVIQADQRKYISSLLNSLTLLVNAVLTVILIDVGANVHTVKIVGTIAFAIRPIFLYRYAKRYYHLNSNAKPNDAILSQRWDGLAQHIAFFVHKNTDIAVLTLLANVKEVSVYSVYMLAVSGCSKIVSVFTSGFEAAFGNMIAKGEKDVLSKRFKICALLTFQATVVFFSSAGVVLTPFIRIYTRGITDANYLRPTFGIIMLVAEAVYSIRIPYQAVVYAAGHFKQTRNGAIAEAAINIGLSVALVPFWGIDGVAIGTLVAMSIRTAQYIAYYHRVIMEENATPQIIKLMAISCVEIIGIILVSKLLPMETITVFASWLISSVIIVSVSGAIVGLFTAVFYWNEFKQIVTIVIHLFRKRRK